MNKNRMRKLRTGPYGQAIGKLLFEHLLESSYGSRQGMAVWRNRTIEIHNKKYINNEYSNNP